MELKKIGLVILAAGNSARMGKPKQLLSYQNKTLLANALEAGKAVVEEYLVLVLGANYEVVAAEAEKFDLQVLQNTDWAQGMGTSIAAGTSWLCNKYPDLDAVMVSVCDQPYLSAGVFEHLIEEARRTGKTIVASAYAGTVGVPVLFTKYHFNELIRLTGKEGAKTLLLSYQQDVALVPFEKGAVDIDTPEDYYKLENP